jgi:hypothetical protein
MVLFWMSGSTLNHLRDHLEEGAMKRFSYLLAQRYVASQHHWLQLRIRSRQRRRREQREQGLYAICDGRRQRDRWAAEQWPRGGHDAHGGVIDVAVTDVLNNVEANLNALNGANVSVVCLNDALNQNNVQILQDVFNGIPILNKQPGCPHQVPERQQHPEWGVSIVGCAGCGNRHR